MRDGKGVEARSLSALVDAVLPRAWRRESPWHGEAHWHCVTATGLDLASAEDGVDRPLVFCFGLLHDTRRENETVDPEHGARAAALARELRAEGALSLEEQRFAALEKALRLHSAGRVSDDPTIGVCWDADRLHLPRVSIEPNPALFSTMTARSSSRLAAADLLRRDGPPEWRVLATLAGASP